MTIKTDDYQAPPREVKRGSPQGSVLGCLLYCITTQRLTLNLGDATAELAGRAAELPPVNSEMSGTPELAGLPAIGASGTRIQHLNVGNDGGGHENVADDTDAATTEVAAGLSGVPKLLSFKYIDDTTIFYPARLETATRHITTATTVKRFEELPLGPVLDCLSRRSEEIGMKINTDKTQLLVVSPNNGCLTSAVMIAWNGTQIVSEETLKLVGFHFGSSPGAGKHVAQLRNKFRVKIWMIYHLREAGMRGMDLFRLYCCYVRAVVEYCAPVFHSLLTSGQEEVLEKMHRLAVRICFGFHTPVDQTMQIYGIETLKSRRVRRYDSLIRKAFHNPTFRDKWFPKRPPDLHNLRRRREVTKTRAQTTRMFNTPLAFFQRRANELGLA